MSSIDDYLRASSARDAADGEADRQSFLDHYFDLAKELWPRFVAHLQGEAGRPLVAHGEQIVRRGVLRREVTQSFEKTLARRVVPVGGRVRFELPKGEDAPFPPPAKGVYLDLDSGEFWASDYMNRPRGGDKVWAGSVDNVETVGQQRARDIWLRREGQYVGGYNDPIRFTLFRMMGREREGLVSPSTPSWGLWPGAAEPVPRWKDIGPLLEAAGQFEDFSTGEQVLPDWSHHHVRQYTGLVKAVTPRAAFDLLEAVFKTDPMRWGRWRWTARDDGKFRLMAINARNYGGGRPSPTVAWTPGERVVHFEVPAA